MKTIRNFKCTGGALLPVVLTITILGLCGLTWEWRRVHPAAAKHEHIAAHHHHAHHTHPAQV